MALFVIFAGAGFVLGSTTGSRALLIAGLLIGTYLLFSIKVADQWEKVAVLRLGRYIGLRGPGWFHVVPIIDMLSRRVDQRVRTANVTAESTLTRDTVPVNVDAIVFWMVWNAEKSILEVQDFVQAIMMSAQTGLRESIGRHELAQMITERESLGRELQRILDEKTNPWGITVQSVEIRDVRIPQALEDAMSRQAQAERERQARNILGQAETEIIQAAPTPVTKSGGFRGGNGDRHDWAKIEIVADASHLIVNPRMTHGIGINQPGAGILNDLRHSLEHALTRGNLDTGITNEENVAIRTIDRTTDARR